MWWLFCVYAIFSWLFWFTETLKNVKGRYTEDTVRTCSQVCSTFKANLNLMYTSCISAKGNIYYRQSSSHRDCEADVNRAVRMLQQEKLFARQPGRSHPGFERYVNKEEIRNSSLLRGYCVLAANQLAWEQDFMPEIDADALNEEDDLSDISDLSTTDSEFDLAEWASSPVSDTDEWVKTSRPNFPFILLFSAKTVRSAIYATHTLITPTRFATTCTGTALCLGHITHHIPKHAFADALTGVHVMRSQNNVFLCFHISHWSVSRVHFCFRWAAVSTGTSNFLPIKQTAST